MSEQLPSRRILFTGTVGLGALMALAGCGGSESEPDAGGTTADATPTTSTSGSSPSSDGTAKAGPALAATGDIPVGGGLILPDERLVITQPKAGEFHGFSAACTHQGFTVTSVADGTIMCNHHGSTFNAATGEVTGGPANGPLESVKLKVDGKQIFRA